MNLILCQFDIAWEDRGANHQRVREMLEANPPPAGSLLVLPEMFNTGFSMNVAAVSEGTDEPGRRFMSELARRWNISILGGVVSAGPMESGYNSALLVGPDGTRKSRYDKLHLFSFAQEDRHYLPGEGLVTFQVGGFKAAPFICYDLRFPEVFRDAALLGARLMIVIANWPASRAEHWTTLLRARAIENQAYVAGVNRVGNDPIQQYAGGSRIIDPMGAILAEAGDTPTLLSAMLDPAVVEQWRSKFPALRDRRG